LHILRLTRQTTLAQSIAKGHEMNFNIWPFDIQCEISLIDVHSTTLHISSLLANSIPFVLLFSKYTLGCCLLRSQRPTNVNRQMPVNVNYLLACGEKSGFSPSTSLTSMPKNRLIANHSADNIMRKTSIVKSGASGS